MILTALGWLAALGLLAISASSAWWTLPGRRRGGQLVAAAVYACAAITILAVMGVLALIPAITLAVAAAATAVVATLIRREVPGDAFGHVAEGIGLALRLGRRLSGWSRLQLPSLLSRARDGAEPDSPEAAVAEAAAIRGIPNVMDDPTLGPAPEPAELVAGNIPAPAPYAALAAFIAGFEPEDDQALRMFMEGSAAGSVMVADAWHHFADTCLNSVGLDPAFVAGILEAGDSAGGHGTLLAQVHKRFAVIYGAIKEWVGAHGPLPHKARDFLTGE